MRVVCSFELGGTQLRISRLGYVLVTNDPPPAACIFLLCNNTAFLLTQVTRRLSVGRGPSLCPRLSGTQAANGPR